ncbi:hypothetical protein R1flu_000912 [Riccia fluitans]|uniref:Uncharacterized protein n=1 Tax=Riccia fluitans TaxID=41844 RepID=A0ABD1Y4Q7_9MARC
MDWSVSPGLPPASSIEENWLILLSFGLEDVHSITAAVEGTDMRMVFLLLESMGLLRFLANMWRIQDVHICQEFVMKWVHKTKTTEVLGIPIDVSYENFTILTGLESIDSTRSDHGPIERMRFVEYVITLLTTPLSFSLQNDPVLQSLLEVMNHTLWLAKKHATSPPSMDLLYLIMQSMRGGNEDWCKFIYERFVDEVRDLQDIHHNYPEQKLRTLAGPLMCFLYFEAKCQYEARMSAWLVPFREIDPNRAFCPDMVQTLKQKGPVEYRGGELVPRRNSRVSLTLPSAPNHIISESGQDKTNTGSRLLLAVSTHQELQIDGEAENPEGITLFGPVDKHKLNREHEEQKHNQEQLKRHMRTYWREQPRKIPCDFGCCVEPVSSPKQNF